jgi:DNA-directed RNA polymerase subunit RPC12/RpoP
LPDESEITFIVEYRCPRCDAALEARSSQADAWLRCPRCGCAALPPAYMKTPRPQPHGPIGPDVLVIGPVRPDPSAPRGSPFRPGCVRRILGLTVLCLSLMAAVNAVYQHLQGPAMFFTLVALASLAFAVYPARR